MRSFLDFIELRPFFTFKWLRIFWFAFLLGQAWRLFQQIKMVIRAFTETDIIANLIISASFLLSTLTYIVVVRLLIEVSMFLLAQYSSLYTSSQGRRD